MRCPLLAGAMALLAGCASTGAATRAHSAPSTAVAPTGSAGTVGPDRTCTASDLVLRISATSSGRGAHIRVSLTSRAPVLCTVNEEASTPDIAVTDARGPVWAAGCDHSASGHEGPAACPMFVMLRPLSPGATQAWAQDWDGTADAAPGGSPAAAPSGAYTAHAAVGGATASAGFMLS